MTQNTPPSAGPQGQTHISPQGNTHTGPQGNTGTRPRGNARKAWKLIPGILVSVFFLWRTLRGITFSTFRQMHFVAPVWIVGGILALLIGYTIRIYRWYIMLRPSSPRVSFLQCARVLLTSFAANNILPFRIGDFLRVFAYAGDLDSNSSAILSTVILERLLDIFMLLAILAASLAGGGAGLPSFRLVEPIFLAVLLAVLFILFGAALLERLIKRLMRALPAGGFVTKLENYLIMAFEAVTKLSFATKIGLLVTTVAAWLCEGMIFVSAARLLGVQSGPRGPWLALSLSNLSYLIPSSPGAIGPFEYFSKLGMTSQGAAPDVSALFGFLVHIYVLLAITVAGGIAFLVHRAGRRNKQPLLEEMEQLPPELPQH